MKILINHDLDAPIHSTSWIPRWIELCESLNYSYDVLDLLQVDQISTLKNYDILLWNIGNYSYEEMLEARSIINAAESMGVKVFPSFNENWHFDDKVAEMFILQAVNAPMPKSTVYFSKKSLNEALKENKINFPIVAKLRTGSGSHNVKLIKKRTQLERYANRMFGKGFKPAPSIIYKTSSNIRSSHDWNTFVSKFKRIPEFFRTWNNAQRFPREKGYVYLQEFIPNDNYDIKVVVIGDKCTGFYRPVRSHDFRASGGGAFVDDASIFTEQIVKSAFATADALGMRCVGFDYVVDKRTGEGKIIEMSYGVGHNVNGSGGYYDRNYQWIPNAIRIEDEILKFMIEDCLQID